MQQYIIIKKLFGMMHTPIYALALGARKNLASQRSIIYLSRAALRFSTKSAEPASSLDILILVIPNNNSHFLLTHQSS